MGLNSFAPSFLVPELAEAPVIRGQTRMLLSGVIPGTLSVAPAPRAARGPTNADYVDGPALAGWSPFSQGGAVPV